MPFWIISQGLTPTLAIVEAGKSPDMDNLVDRSDLRIEIADQAAEVLLLDSDTAFLDNLEIGGDRGCEPRVVFTSEKFVPKRAPGIVGVPPACSSR